MERSQIQRILDRAPTVDHNDLRTFAHELHAKCMAEGIEVSDYTHLETSELRAQVETWATELLTRIAA